MEFVDYLIDLGHEKSELKNDGLSMIWEQAYILGQHKYFPYFPYGVTMQGTSFGYERVWYVW